MSKKKISYSHIHIPPKIINSQIDYAKSDLAFITAKNIIFTKLRNSRMTFTDYRQARLRALSDESKILIKTQQSLYRINQQISNIDTYPELFQLEARAAKVYWKSFGILCKQSSNWKRIYPHAKDQLNILLNTGYTILANNCLKAIIDATLLPEIGLFHKTKDALVYDLMECFRQTAVDIVIIPFFSRKSRKRIESGDFSLGKIFKGLSDRYQKRFYYNGRCERLNRIIHLEAIQLRKAIVKKIVWNPYKHYWGHGKKCK